MAREAGYDNATLTVRAAPAPMTMSSACRA